MKLDKTTFDNIKENDECMFKNYKNVVVQYIKIGVNTIQILSHPIEKSLWKRIKQIFDNGQKHYTGQFHEIYKVEK